MKTLRREVAVAILTLALATSAFAGNISCPGVASAEPGTTGTNSAETEITDIIVTIVEIAGSLPPY